MDLSQYFKPLRNILLLGDEFVGKTSLIKRYINEENSGKCRTSYGADLFTKELILNDSLVSLQIWEILGYDGFNNKSTKFYRAAHGCILVFDVTRRKSFESLNSWWSRFFFMTNKKNPDEFAVAVVGNKIDLDNERKVSKQEAQDWCNSLSIPYFECSSKDDINVQQMFETMIGKMEKI